VVPTVALINEAAAQFRRLSPQRPAECIHNETADIVGAALMKALKERPVGGRILFITWSAFLSLPFFPGRELWSAYFNEIPQVTTVDELLVPTSHVHLTAHVEVRPQGPVWGRVVVGGTPSPCSLRGGPRDSLRTARGQLDHRPLKSGL
jgi:hypothetical protein